MSTDATTAAGGTDDVLLGERATARDVPAQLARGFAMGAADIVPGVSGGTVALLLGIYARLIGNVRLGAASLSRAVRGDVRGFLEQLRAVDWFFLVPLGGGVVAAVGALSHLLEDLLVERPEEMAGLFFGLVLASVAIAWRLVEAHDVGRIVVMLAVAAATALLLGLQAGPLSDPALPLWFGAGAIAICAMILPGISGSFLLLMLGMYAPLLAAVNDRDLLPVGVFLVGAVVGLASFSTVLSYALRRWYDTIMAALLGLMLGSLRVLWPWPNGVGVISDHEDEVVSGTGIALPDGDWLAPVVLAVVAFVVVVGVSRFAERREAATTPDVETV